MTWRAMNEHEPWDGQTKGQLGRGKERMRQAAQHSEYLTLK
jgi:hypothetical protein